MLGQRVFVLPEAFAWFANLLGIAYVIVTTVLFLFPPELLVTGSNMNYCIVAFAIVLIISTIQWSVDRRKNFKGPQVDLEVLQVDSRTQAVPGVKGKGEEEAHDGSKNN
ncbi:MAG: hypothetical protein Q9222_002193 [Ikaeria aurantiellina]